MSQNSERMVINSNAIAARYTIEKLVPNLKWLARKLAAEKTRMNAKLDIEISSPYTLFRNQIPEIEKAQLEVVYSPVTHGLRIKFTPDIEIPSDFFYVDTAAPVWQLKAVIENKIDILANFPNPLKEISTKYEIEFSNIPDRTYTREILEGLTNWITLFNRKKDLYVALKKVNTRYRADD